MFVFINSGVELNGSASLLQRCHSNTSLIIEEEKPHRIQSPTSKIPSTMRKAYFEFSVV